MKHSILFTVLIIFSIGAYSQKENTGSGLKSILQDVLRASAEDFISLRGEQVSGETGTIQYLSTIQAPGSKENKVIGYIGPKKTDWVWESRLNSFEDINDKIGRAHV